MAINLLKLCRLLAEYSSYGLNLLTPSADKELSNSAQARREQLTVIENTTIHKTENIIN